MKKALLVVQGEGRGHMTQAISSKQLLEKSGYIIVGVLVGIGKNRTIPDFFKKHFNCPIDSFSSPNFMFKKIKELDITRSVLNTIINSRKYIKEITFIHQKIVELDPDVIINFYEPLINICHLFYKLPCPLVAVSHQYIYLHPDFHFPPGIDKIQQASLLFFTKLTSIGANKKIALSLYPKPSTKEVTILPPLIRNEVFTLKPEKKDFLLIYILNAGISDDIIQWHKSNPDTQIHCFWDKINAPAINKVDDNLIFHTLDEETFLNLMSKCNYYISTAGFESIAEAAYLGKNICMIPVTGHQEQLCNAIDTTNHGIGKRNEKFDIDHFMAQDYKPHDDSFPKRIQTSYQNNEFVREIDEVISSFKPSS